MKKSDKRMLLLLVPLIFITIFSFQNCAPGFQSLQTKLASADLPSIAALEAIDCDGDEAQLLSKSCLTLKPVQYKNFQEYEPQYPLYSDGATKRRWIYLPNDLKIDSSDIDSWIFPVGTVLWKEFSINGKKIETRKLFKFKEGVGFESWKADVYLWRADQSDADLATTDIGSLSASDLVNFEAGNVFNQYSLVSQNKCMTCHQGAKDTSLGFSYFQLSKPASSFGISQVSQLSWLNNPPTRPDSIPGNELDQKAIGYLQPNCATCHSSSGSMPSLSFAHNSNFRILADENVFKSAAQRPGVLVPGDPASSSLYKRMAGGTMPPKSTVFLHRIDSAGLAILSNWIKQLPPAPAPAPAPVPVTDPAPAPAPNNPPVVAFTFNCTNLACVFSSSGTSDADGSIYSYAWKFGATGTSALETPNFTFPAAGEYLVSLKVTDNLGASTTISKTVNVTVPPNKSPVVAFTFNCTNLACVFSSSGTSDADGSIYSYDWSFGAAGTSALETPNFTFPGSGGYVVSLKVTDNLGATTTISKNVNVTAAPNVPPVVAFTFNCTNLTCAFSSSGSSDSDGSIYSYAWKFGATGTSALETPNFTFSGSGAYLVSLKVTDNLGASTTISKTVNITVP